MPETDPPRRPRKPAKPKPPPAEAPATPDVATTGDPSPTPGPESFRNTQDRLNRELPRLLDERRQAGLEGLVGGLAAILIRVEHAHQQPAVLELLRHTGLELADTFQASGVATCVLKAAGSADVLIQAGAGGDNPFAPYNDRPRSRHLPNTRLETCVFETPDLPRYVSIQRGRGVKFLTETIFRSDSYSFIQTAPSPLTGSSVGFVQWHGPVGRWAYSGSSRLSIPASKPAAAHLKKVREVDHVATRLRAEDRDDALLEFLRLTNYQFSFSIYVESLNSITNVARAPFPCAAMVFTSGIAPYVSDEASGPTELFVRGYGPRAHHVAFRTEDIVPTFAAIKADGMQFLIELVGSEQEGLRQTFTQPSPHTLLVTEYIQRYGGFDGFFAESNVTALTRATARQ